jgi:hypothetical protein
MKIIYISSNFRKSSAFLKFPRFRPLVLLLSLKAKMVMEHYWNDIDGKTELFGELSLPVPLC